MAPEVRTTLARLAPIVFGLLAVAAFAVGILLQMQINARHAALGQIYLDGPPAPVAIDRFDPARNSNAVGEARLTSVLDLEAARRLGPLSEGGPTALAVPLRTGSASADPAGLAIFVMADPTLVTPDGLRAVAGPGAAANPLLTLNGKVRRTGPWQAAVTSENLGAFASAGPVIFPFIEGRRTAILPPDYGQSSAVRTYSWIAGVFTVLALIAFAADVRGRRLVTGPEPRKDKEEVGDVAAVSLQPPAPEPEATFVLTGGDEADLPEVEARRSPTRAILLGLALTFLAAASILAYPGLADRFGIPPAIVPEGGIETWADARWQAAMAGDLRAILVLVLGSVATLALAVKVTVDTIRRPMKTAN